MNATTDIKMTKHYEYSDLHISTTDTEGTWSNVQNRDCGCTNAQIVQYTNIRVVCTNAIVQYTCTNIDLVHCIYY